MNRMISIIIPTYNRINELKKCVNSVIEQKIDSDIEIIICDDSDNNSVAEYLSGLTILPPKRTIKYIKNEKPLGPGGNRNIGAKSARGDILGFIDDDCFYTEGAFEKIKRIIFETDTDIVRFKIEVIGKEKISFFTHQPSIKDFGKKEYGGLFFIKKEIFNKIGGFEATFYDKKTKIHFREDTEFFFRAFDIGVNEEYIDEVLAVHPVFPGSYYKPFKEIQRLKYDLAFEKKWKKYLVEGNYLLGIRITPKFIKLWLSILQIIGLLFTFYKIDFIFIYMFFHTMHYIFYRVYARKTTIKDNIVMNIELLIIPYYNIYIYLLSWVIYLKMKKNI